MNYITHIDAIIEKLRKNGNELDASKVTTVFRSSFTSTEILMSVTKELLGLINKDPNLSQLIGVDVQQLETFCRSIGLYVY